MNEYLVVVPASDLVLFEYLEQRFKGDPATSVLVDRRKTPRPAPAGLRRTAVLGHGVTVVRLGESPASPTGAQAHVSWYGVPRDGPPNPPTFGAPRHSRGAPLNPPTFGAPGTAGALL